MQNPVFLLLPAPVFFPFPHVPPPNRYDIHTHERVSHNGILSVPVTPDRIPVYQRGGSIVPRKERVRRSSPLMHDDPITLRVALDRAGAAAGTLYIDDGETYEYRNGKSLYMQFAYADGKLTGHQLKEPGEDGQDTLKMRVLVEKKNLCSKPSFSFRIRDQVLAGARGDRRVDGCESGSGHPPDSVGGGAAAADRPRSVGQDADRPQARRQHGRGVGDNHRMSGAEDGGDPSTPSAIAILLLTFLDRPVLPTTFAIPPRYVFSPESRDKKKCEKIM